MLVNNRISILGCGWLGLPSAIALIKKGRTVKGSTTSIEKLKQLRDHKIEPYLIDLEKAVDADDASFFDCDVLIVAVPSSKLTEVRLDHLLTLLVRHHVKKIILISSTSQFRDDNVTIDESNSQLYLVENSPVRKIETAFCSTSFFETTVLQMGGLIGYDRHPGKFAHSKKILANPNGKVNLIHQDDAVRIIERLLDDNLKAETFLCCADGHPSKKDFYTQAALFFGASAPVFETADNDGYKIILNNKVKEKLNFEFLPLMDGI